jgi:hypothetical protein
MIRRQPNGEEDRQKKIKTGEDIYSHLLSSRILPAL